MTHNPDNDARERDRYALDAIATLLGTAERWNVEDLETIADVVGKVRPHPGSGAPAKSYANVFNTSMGRDVPRAYDRTPDAP